MKKVQISVDVFVDDDVPVGDLELFIEEELTNLKGVHNQFATTTMVTSNLTSDEE